MIKVLIVGNGPTHSNISFIKNFDGPIICCDVTARNIVENDIIPKYVTFSETREGLEETVLKFLPNNFLKHDITVVYRSNCISLIGNRSHILKLKTLIFDVETYVNNVGLYSIVFAIEHLKVEELHLIGLEHKGEEYPQLIFENWINSFKKYMSKKPNCKIIDHSGGDLSKYIMT